MRILKHWPLQKPFKDKLALPMISALLIAILLSLRSEVGAALALVLMFLSVSQRANFNTSVYRVATFAVLLVGLSPIYLIIRGIFTHNPLGAFDLLLYLGLFYASYTLTFRRFSRIQDGFKVKSSTRNLSEVAASLSGLILTFILEIYLRIKSVGDSVAWIASGDSKNHLVNGVEIVGYGYLNPLTFLTQPVSSPTFLALFLSHTENEFDSQIVRLASLMQVYAIVWVVLIGILGLSFASIFQLMWNLSAGENAKQIPLKFLAAASLIPTFSFALGPLLFDGFFTAIYGIATVVMMTAWFLSLKKLERATFRTIALGLLLFASSLMAWMFVVPLTGLLLLAGIRDQLLKLYRKPLAIDTFLFLTVFAFGSAIHFSSHGQSVILQAKQALSASGAVNVTPPTWYLLGILFILLLGLMNSKAEYSKSLILISTGHAVSLFLFKKFSNLELLDWNYYLLKYQWIMLVSLTPLIFALAIGSVRRRLQRNFFLRMIQLALIASITFLASESIVVQNNVWSKVLSGWENPRSSIVNKMFEQEIDDKNPTLFFHYGYLGDAKIANFWMNAFMIPVEPIKGWNYTIDTNGDVQQLCDVNAYYPSVNVVTSDLRLGELLESTCPSETFQIRIIEASL
jgi:hypothetical protein